MGSTIILLILMIAVTFAVVAVEGRSRSAFNYRLPSPLTQPIRYKRQSYQMIYPQRTLMFTGFYRPPSKSSAELTSTQASGIYAQGNSVGGGTYFQPRPAQPLYLNDNGPTPVDEPELFSEAAPENPTAEQDLEQPLNQEGGLVPEEPKRKDLPKKSKKLPIAPPQDENEYEDEDDTVEEEEEEQIPGVPQIPFRPPNNKRRKNRPYSLNNFFPVVFSIPSGGFGRKIGTTGIPGLITAVANSYSTSKGGVASSVATAYGGPTPKKQKRQSTY